MITPQTRPPLRLRPHGLGPSLRHLAEFLLNASTTRTPAITSTDLGDV